MTPLLIMLAAGVPFAMLVRLRLVWALLLASLAYELWLPPRDAATVTLAILAAAGAVLMCGRAMRAIWR